MLIDAANIKIHDMDNEIISPPSPRKKPIKLKHIGGRKSSFKAEKKKAEANKMQREMSMIKHAAKRANSQLKEVPEGDNDDLKNELPSINDRDKRKILNELGLRGINKIRNVHNLMSKLRRDE